MWERVVVSSATALVVVAELTVADEWGDSAWEILRRGFGNRTVCVAGFCALMVSVTVKPVDEGEVLTLEVEVRTVVVAMPNDSMDELLLNRAISSVRNAEGILTVVTIPSGASDLLGLLIDGKESAVQVLVMACVNVEEFVLVLLSDTEVQ
jgi:hypothetical protein